MAQKLNEQTRRRVEELARKKGKRCEECGSADQLVSEEVATVGTGNPDNPDSVCRVYLWCEVDWCFRLNRGGGALEFTRDEAREIGIKVDPDDYLET